MSVQDYARTMTLHDLGQPHPAPEGRTCCPRCAAPYGADIIRPERALWLWIRNTDSFARRLRDRDCRPMWAERVESWDAEGRCAWCALQVKRWAAWERRQAELAEEQARRGANAPKRAKARQKREAEQLTRPATAHVPPPLGGLFADLDEAA